MPEKLNALVQLPHRLVITGNGGLTSRSFIQEVIHEKQMGYGL